MNIIDELDKRYKYFEDRKSLAKIRKDGENIHEWHYGFIGFHIPEDEIRVIEGVRLRRVINPPGEVELAGPLKDKSLLSPICRYTSGIGCELSIDTIRWRRHEQIAWWVTVGIRLISKLDFIVPAASSHSWSVICCADQNTCDITLVEDYPRAKLFSDSDSNKTIKMDWVTNNLLPLAEILEDKRFRMAVDSYTTFHHEASSRMSIASLWSGVEALLGITTELRFRIASVIAAILSERGEGRVALYNKIKKLYDFRSKVVHGSEVTNEDMNRHIVEVRNILSDLLVKFTEGKKMPTKDELDELIHR